MQNGTASRDGWPATAYCVSKACINAMTAILARENGELIINCCCPGWVSTDMGKQVGQPTKTPGMFLTMYSRVTTDHYWQSREAEYHSGSVSTILVVPVADIGRTTRSVAMALVRYSHGDFTEQALPENTCDNIYYEVLLRVSLPFDIRAMLTSDNHKTHTVTS